MSEALDPGTYVALLGAMSQPLQLELTPMQAAALLGNLQLALRHPGNTGPSAEVTRDIATRLVACCKLL